MLLSTNIFLYAGAPKMLLCTAVCTEDVAATAAPTVLQGELGDGCTGKGDVTTKQHDLRVRTFPHVEGMYPTTVMIPGRRAPASYQPELACFSVYAGSTEGCSLFAPWQPLRQTTTQQSSPPKLQ